MSLEIIEYTYTGASGEESELLTTIKQRTGLEMEALDEGRAGLRTWSMRFPDMETAQSIKLQYLNASGTFFIDADNHFLCYSIASGLQDYNYVDELYKALIFDYNGKLVNVCYSVDKSWGKAMNACGNALYYCEDDYSKRDITLCPLRVDAHSGQNGADSVQAFVKNCYANYERRFQRNLKFIDQNGNRFVTLGGYLLYKVN